MYALGTLALLALCALAYAARIRLRLQRALARQCQSERRHMTVFDWSARFTIASGESAADVLETLEAAVHALEPYADALLIFVPDGDELRCVHAAGVRAERSASMRLPLQERSLPAAAASTRLAQYFDGKNAALLASDRAAICVPLLYADSYTAVVYCSSMRQFGDVALAVRVISQAAAPFAVASHRDSDRRNARYDALTNLLTPRAFRELLRSEIASCGRHDTLALWFVDTDSFKAVNDTFGHAAGDRVLRTIATELRACMHEGIDVAARNGGDEFCAIVKHAGKVEAIHRAAKLCEAIRRCDFGDGIRLTVSIGVACYPVDASSAPSLLEAADAAMYYSKRSGRDRVAFAAAPGEFAVFE